MPLIIRDDTNTPRTISELVIRDDTNTPQTISELWVRDTTNTPRLVFTTAPPLSASASPDNVFGGVSGSGTADSNSTTVTPSGGVGPYSYTWTCLSHTSSTTPLVNSPASSTTNFTQGSLGIDDTQFATFQCVVADSLLSTVTVYVDATFTAF